jgi:hypothetical protein
MKRAAFLILFLVVLGACRDDDAPKPLNEPGEKLYVVRGMILSRDPAANTLNLDHERVEGFMEAMKMDYAVRGANVDSFPPDSTRIEAQLHVTERSYWITDVKPIS